ncbi:MAG: hypothetical protein JWM11_5474 [Planctomycetaceae bacterium]|nr:hypothetical protein [Planctomycetaceae bacterium]
MAPRDPRSADDPSRPASKTTTPSATTPAKSTKEPQAAPIKKKRPFFFPGPASESATAAKSAATVKILIQADPLDPLASKSWLERIKKELAEGVSGLSVSIALHLVVFFLLGLMVFTTSEGLEEHSGFIATWISQKELAEEQRKLALAKQPVEIAAIAVDAFKPPPKEDKTASEKAPVTDSVEAQEQKFSTGKAAKVDQALAGRTENQKLNLLKLFGGTKQSEDAVGRGLGWLVRQQQSDGRWELHRGYDNPGSELLRTDTGATSLALLCFLGAGYTHQDGKYKEVVRKGLNWLMKVQKSDGNLHDFQELGRQTAFYAHGQGTIALCEAYAMTRDSSLQEPIRKALKFIYDSQNEHGGWQYQPGAVGDLSVTGWQVMALQSARMAGFDVPEDVLARITLFLNSVSSNKGRRYRYKAADPESLFSPAMTAEGLLCRQYLGWKKDHPALQEGVQWLLEEQNLPRWTEGRRNVYFWYYATQVMHHMEGEVWETWNKALRDQITSAQVKSGKMGGSWHPSKPKGDNHEYGEAGGRLYITCLSILTLEVYYRHMPLYRNDEAEKPAAE